MEIIQHTGLDKNSISIHIEETTGLMIKRKVYTQSCQYLWVDLFFDETMKRTLNLAAFKFQNERLECLSKLDVVLNGENFDPEQYILDQGAVKPTSQNQKKQLPFKPKTIGMVPVSSVNASFGTSFKKTTSEF